MRTYGRVNGKWVVVTTDAQGNNDAVWLTTLAQVCNLEPGEDPFWGNYGIPGQASQQSQIPPDQYVALTQQQFSPYFISLILSRQAARQSAPPTYNFVAMLHNGVTISNAQVPV
jgi:hypothetical protein